MSPPNKTPETGSGSDRNPNGVQPPADAAGRVMAEVNQARLLEVRRVTDRPELAAAAQQEALDPYLQMSQAIKLGDILKGFVGQLQGDNIPRTHDQLKNIAVTVIYDRNGEILNVKIKGANDGAELPPGATSRDMTALDCVSDLKKQINEKIGKAIGAAQDIDPKKVGELQTLNAREREPLAREFGFRNSFPTVQAVELKINQIARQNADLLNWRQKLAQYHELEKNKNTAAAEQKLQEMATLEQRISQNPALAGELRKLQKLDDLLGLVDEAETLKMWRHAEGVMKLRAADLKIQGVTDVSNNNAENFGVGKPSPREITDAFSLVNQAGRASDEVKFSGPNATDPENFSYDAVYRRICAAHTQATISPLMEMMRQAAELEKKGDLAGAERKFRECAEATDAINLQNIRAQLKNPAVLANPAHVATLGVSLSAVYEARMNYANFLIKRGRGGEALDWLFKAGNDTPEFIMDKGQERERARYMLLLNSATYGNAANGDQIKLEWQNFEKSMNERKFDDAEDSLDFLKTNCQVTKDKVKDAVRALTESQKKIETDLADLRSRDLQRLSEFDRKLEEDKIANLDNRLTAVKKAVEENQKIVDELERQYHLVRYAEASVALSLNDVSTAHQIYKELKATAPEIAGDETKHLDELCEETRPKEWYEWKALKKWICIGLAGLAGLAVGVATVWTGPGAVVFGAGTTAAILTTMGVAAVGGALAGGAVGWGAQSLLDGKMASSEDFFRYAVVGGSTATMVASGPLFVGGLPSQTAAASLTATRSWMATAAIRTGNFLGPGAIGATTDAVGNNLLDMAYHGESFGQASRDTAFESALGTIFYKMSPVNKRITGLGRSVQPSVVPRVSLGRTMIGQRGLGTWLAFTNPTMGREALGPMIIDTYHSRSPVQLPILGRPAHLPNDPKSDDPVQRERFWQTWQALN